MAPRSVQGTVIILDIGKNVSMEREGKTFFQSARDCTARIIEHKILSRDNNLLGVLLVGCKSSKRNNEEGIVFNNISWMEKPQNPTWNMIRNLPKELTEYKGDWMDSILTATDYLKNRTGVKLSSMKIIIMTNFEAPTMMEAKEIKSMLKGLGKESFEIIIIGPDIYEENCKNYDFELARQIIESTNGSVATFADVIMNYLQFHKKKALNPTAWNADLCIGPNLKIPISTYIRIKDESVVGKWGKYVKDPVTLTKSTKEAIGKPKKNLHV